MATLALLVSFSRPPIACAGQKREGQKKSPRAKAVRVVELHKIDDLKGAFEADAGKVRLVTILSPT